MFFFETVFLALSVNAPIQIIITIGQWLLMTRFLKPEAKTISRKTIADNLSCLVLTYLTAFLLSLPIWLFWPFDPELILYSNRISIPAIAGEIIAIPFWLKQYGYFGDNQDQ